MQVPKRYACRESTRSLSLMTTSPQLHWENRKSCFNEKKKKLKGYDISSAVKFFFFFIIDIMEKIGRGRHLQGSKVIMDILSWAMGRREGKGEQERCNWPRGPGLRERLRDWCSQDGWVLQGPEELGEGEAQSMSWTEKVCGRGLVRQLGEPCNR